MEEGSMLYLVNLVDLVQEGNDNYPFLKSLADLSNDYFNISCLQDLVANPRNQLFVLLSPSKNWDQDGIQIYCAIQIYYEGFNMLGRDEYQKISQHLISLASFPHQPKGAQIITLFSSSEDPSQCEYSLLSLNLLICYFEGEMRDQDIDELPEVAVELVYQLGGTDPKKIDYLGVYCECSLDWLILYEQNNFVQLSLKSVFGLNGGPVEFAMMRRFNEFDSEDVLALYTFEIFLEGVWLTVINSKDYLEPSFTLRVIKFKNQLISKNPLDETEMKEFLNDEYLPRVVGWVNDKKSDFTLGSHILTDFAYLYFKGKLPIDLDVEEEKVLLLTGALCYSTDDDAFKEKLNLSDREIDRHLKNMYGKLLQYYYIRFPQKA